jgi:hypothetical protein
LAADETPVAPQVAEGVPVRYVDPAAPWLTQVGGEPTGSVYAPAVVARVAIRYDESRADLVHDTEFETVLFPLADVVDVTTATSVDYDDRDLLADPPPGVTHRLTPAKIETKRFFTGIERDLRDHLTGNLELEIERNVELGLFSRPGESPDDFAARCRSAAQERGDTAIAALREKYEAKAIRLRDQIEAAEDRVSVLEAEADAKRDSELFSTAGTVLGGLLSGKRSAGSMLGDLLGDAGTAARRRGTTTASNRRVDAAENKVQRLLAQYDELEADAEREVERIAATCRAAASAIEPMRIGLERSDVKVTQLSLAWVPVA